MGFLLRYYLYVRFVIMIYGFGCIVRDYAVGAIYWLGFIGFREIYGFKGQLVACLIFIISISITIILATFKCHI
jgi:hypothetical protein